MAPHHHQGKGTAAQAARLLLLVSGVLLPFLFGSPASAKEEVDLELVLMVDVSGSIDHQEFTLQRIGYARAFQNPRVASAIRSGPLGRIAIAYVEWTGPFLQTVVVDWTVLSNDDTVLAFAEQLEELPRSLFSGGTAVGAAILYGAESIKANSFNGSRRVIDISGDGPTNRGIPAAVARDEVVAQGFTVNGLPILTDYRDLDLYYLDNVIGGPGAFSISARDFQDFNSAILTKLILEIAGLQDPDVIQAAANLASLALSHP